MHISEFDKCCYTSYWESGFFCIGIIKKMSASLISKKEKVDYISLLSTDKNEFMISRKLADIKT